MGGWNWGLGSDLGAIERHVGIILRKQILRRPFCILVHIGVRCGLHGRLLRRGWGRKLLLARPNVVMGGTGQRL